MFQIFLFYSYQHPLLYPYLLRILELKVDEVQKNGLQSLELVVLEVIELRVHLLSELVKLLLKTLHDLLLALGLTLQGSRLAAVGLRILVGLLGLLGREKSLLILLRHQPVKDRIYLLSLTSTKDGVLGLLQIEDLVTNRLNESTDLPRQASE